MDVWPVGPNHDRGGLWPVEIDFPAGYNAACFLFDNIGMGRGDRIAVRSDLGNRTYGELAADAGRFGNALKSLGLVPGDRVLMFLDDTPAYPAAFFGAHCDTVRVMPFLDGIPCSIHGVVLPEHLLAIRPCEMVVFRKPASSSFHYASAATFWDPRPEDREAMRAVARRAGAELRRQVGYRGVFTVDGVMTADGFLPTELNPRFGAAINILSRGMPELPLYLLHLAIAEGEPFGWRGPDLEALVVASGDRVRKGGGALMVTVPVTENRAAGLVLGDAGWRWAQEGEPVDAEFKIGPSTSGGRVWVSLNEERTPIGPSAAPRVAEALAFLDRELGLDIGPLEPAPDLRP